MGSEEHIVPGTDTNSTVPLAGSLTMTKDLTIVTQPLECELASGWEGGRGGVLVRSFLPDSESAV